MRLPDLLQYAVDADQLLYRDYRTIRETSRILHTHLVRHARANSPVYRKLYEAVDEEHIIVDKSHLADKSQWYVQGYNDFVNRTSGTTQSQFEYKIWHEVYPIIERDIHYRGVLREFGLDKPLKILYCMYLGGTFASQEVAEIRRTKDTILSHGLGEDAEVHRVLTNRDFYHNSHAFYKRLIDYAIEHKIDVILAQATTVAALAWQVAHTNVTGKICRLLSNTGSMLNRQDAEFLKTAGVIDDWCDHMRCWDGGATFFTCKYHTYHLHDGLSYAHEDNGRLICTDYFSLPSPFYNYWNGDYCTISNDYERCQCGRAYRPFTMYRTKDKSTFGINNGTTKEKLLAAEGGCKIKRIVGNGKHLTIYVSEPLKISEKSSIIAAASGFGIQFVVERD